jgi:hypothetical protein
MPLRNACLVTFNEGTVMIDSMKPASMKPDPWNWKDVGGFLV